MDKLIVSLVTILVMLAAFGLLRKFEELWRRIVELEKEKQVLEKEIQALKDANRKHLPYNTAEELENVLAGIVVLRQELEIKETLLQNIEAHAKLARENKRAGMQQTA